MSITTKEASAWKPLSYFSKAENYTLIISDTFHCIFRTCKQKH